MWKLYSFFLYKKKHIKKLKTWFIRKDKTIYASSEELYKSQNIFIYFYFYLFIVNIYILLETLQDNTVYLFKKQNQLILMIDK